MWNVFESSERFSLGLAVAGLFAAAASPCSASSLDIAHRVHAGAAAQNQLGFATAAVGDLNNDGVAEYIVGVPGATGLQPRALVHNGATGSILRAFGPETGETSFGFSVGGAGDVNGDGFEDVIIGDPDRFVACMVRGTASVYSGANGTLLFHFVGDTLNERFGHAVGGAGDVNGDGFDDFMVGAPLKDGPFGVDCGQVIVYSGVSGSPMFNWWGLPGSRMGTAVAAVGDINQDDSPDIAASAPNKGKVYVLDALNRHVIRIHSGSIGARFGASIANAGDANGDGIDDIVVGAPSTAIPWLPGKAYVYSGSNGSLLHAFMGLQAGDGAGTAVAGAGDFDGDGFDDIAIGAPWCDMAGTDSGRLEIRSGATGQILRLFHANPGYSAFASTVTALGDVNGDDLADLMVGAPNVGADDAGRAFVFLGDFNGSGLENEGDVDTGVAGAFVTSADVNDDDAADLITISPASNQMSVQLSNLDGTFSPADVYGAGNKPVSVAAGDFDRDGDADLAVAASHEDRIIIYRNNGNGEFTKMRKIVTQHRPSAIIAGDFNKDNHIDLAVANQSSDRVSVYLNNRQSSSPVDRRFKSPSHYGVKDGPVALASADLNGDTWPDLAVINRGDRKLSVLLNLRNGKFGPQAVTALGGAPVAVALADFNHDGAIDVAYAGAANGQIGVRINIGNGTFGTGAVFAAGTSPSALLSIDTDFDGYADLVAASASDSMVYVLRNTQDGGFEAGPSFETGDSPRWLTAGDIDGDADQDLISTNAGDETATVIVNHWFD